jgi:hypothetical protein
MAPEDDEASGCGERLEKLEHKLSELLAKGINSAVPKQTVKAADQIATPKKTEQPVKTETKKSGTAEVITKAIPGRGKNEAATEYWQALLESLRKEEYYVFTHAKLALDTRINGNTLEIVFDSEDELSADFLKNEPAEKAVLERIRQHSADIVGISVEIKAKPDDNGDLNILEMFGADIERI